MGFVPFIVHPARQQQLRPFDTRVIAASNQRTGFGKEEGASLLPRVRSKPSRKLVHFLISTFWGNFFLTYDDKVCDGVFLRMACLGQGEKKSAMVVYIALSDQTGILGRWDQ